jgi:hypothetical protein
VTDAVKYSPFLVDTGYLMFIFDDFGGTKNESWNQRKNRPGGCGEPGIGTGMH